MACRLAGAKSFIKTNARMLWIGPLWTNVSEILIEIHTFPIKNAFENVIWEMVAIFFSMTVLIQQQLITGQKRALVSNVSKRKSI